MRFGSLSAGFVVAVVAGAAVQAGLLLGVVVLAGGRDALVDPLLWTAIAMLTGWVAAESLALGEVTRPGGGEDRRALARAAALLIGLVVVVALAERAVAPRVDRTQPLGAGLLFGGVVLRVVAVRTLGRWFLDEPRVVPGQPLITHGIYRWMRHPSEVGNVFICLGLACMLGSLGAGALTVGILLPLVVHRVRVEDRVLEEHFGEKWRSR